MTSFACIPWEIIVFYVICQWQSSITRPKSRVIRLRASVLPRLRYVAWWRCHTKVAKQKKRLQLSILVQKVYFRLQLGIIVRFFCFGDFLVISWKFWKNFYGKYHSVRNSILDPRNTILLFTRIKRTYRPMGKTTLIYDSFGKFEKRRNVLCSNFKDRLILGKRLPIATYFFPDTVLPLPLPSSIT